MCIYIYTWKNRKVRNNKSRAFERDKKNLPLGSPAARWQYLLVLPWSTRCPEPIPRSWPLDYCNPQYIKVRKGYEG